MLRMRLLLMLLPAAFGLAGQQAVFRAGVSLVRLDVQVVDGGRPVSGLRAEDFTVLDEGTPARIVYFGQEQEPLWVVLLVDVSGSMRRYLEQMARASREALAALGPGDRVALMLFSRNAALELPFTADRESVAARIDAAVGERGLGSGTAINLSVLEAARYLARAAAGEAGRRAVLILTDNAGLNYQAPDEVVLRALYDADAVLNAIVTPAAKPPPAPPPGRELNPDFTPPDVFALARATGGEVLRASNAGEAFRALIASMRARYSLHCPAAEGAPGAWRRLEVRLGDEARRRHPRAQIRARAGYFLP